MDTQVQKTTTPEIEAVRYTDAQHNPWTVKVHGAHLMTRQKHVRRWGTEQAALAAGRQYLKTQTQSA